MIVEPIVKSSEPLWRKHTDRWLKPLNGRTPMAFVPANEDFDPDPPPAAPAARPWPRVFPGL